MHILALVAGTNDPSNSDMLADAFLEGVRSVEGATAEKIRLKDLDLPQFTLDCYTGACPMPPDYQALRQRILEADGVLIASPIWNFSVPAHLKNAIDWIGCFALDSETRSKGQLAEKPFAFLFTGGAPVAAWKGLMRFTTLHVPESFRYFGATIACLYYEGKAMQGRGTFGLIVDQRPESLAAVRRKGEKFGAFVGRWRTTGRLPLRHRLMEWAYKKGQRIMAKF